MGVGGEESGNGVRDRGGKIPGYKRGSAHLLMILRSTRPWNTLEAALLKKRAFLFEKSLQELTKPEGKGSGDSGSGSLE